MPTRDTLRHSSFLVRYSIFMKARWARPTLAGCYPYAPILEPGPFLLRALGRHYLHCRKRHAQIEILSLTAMRPIWYKWTYWSFRFFRSCGGQDCRHSSGPRELMGQWKSVGVYYHEMQPQSSKKQRPLLVASC